MLKFFRDVHLHKWSRAKKVGSLFSVDMSRMDINFSWKLKYKKIWKFHWFYEKQYKVDKKFSAEEIFMKTRLSFTRFVDVTFSRTSRARDGENFMCKFESEGNFLVDVIFHRCLRIVWILFAEVVGLWMLKKGTNKCFILVDPFVVLRLNIVWMDSDVLFLSGFDHINLFYW